MVNLNLYAKISLLLLSVVTIPTMLLGYLSFSNSSEQIRNVTNAFLLDNLQHNAERVNSLMLRIEQRSEKVIESDKVKVLLREPAPESLLNEFDFIRLMNPVIDELKGEYELNIYPNQPDSYPNYAGGVTGEEGWFKQAMQMEGRGYWHVQATNGSKPTELLYVRAIRDFPQLKPLGVLTMRVPSFLLANQLIIPERVEQLSFYMINDAGTLVATKSNSKDIAITSTTPSSIHPNSPVLKTQINGIEYYEAAKSLGIAGWGLTALIPVSALMGPIENIKQFTWILVVSGISIMSIFLLIIVRKVTIPIKSLVKHMRKIMLGELVYLDSYRQRTDEIGQLIRGYNAMITGMIELLGKTKQFEEEKRRLEIRTLIHQMNPHFLYNTMDTIKWKAEKAQEPAIVNMVTALSNLLRFSINNGEELTTVEREIQHVKNYLSIELQRNHDAFSVFFQVQPNILHYPFMKLTVQPLVENAIKHAVKKMKEGTGKIIVSMYQSGERIVCCVEDNGMGSDQDLAEHFATIELSGGNQESGVGLYNADRRLKLRFGADFGYGISLENRPEGGCKVTLMHPVIEHEAAEA
ncbi:cache domain-containing sensor histidine kinase [Paenibacillus agricola]|uniref:Sensor histidine kinase n=1 Tax=Paenibacillus agricola TaxID=2716264 RepID=A0ABX0IZK1_9BACL|nr:sensor histidine kinase [Paenibacillus agricola]NHN28863.1 sensor histidine kinase [Paenibacillus agricola]